MLRIMHVSKLIRNVIYFVVWTLGHYTYEQV